MTRTQIRVCSVAGCPELTTSGKCAAHTAQAHAAFDATRESSAERGYGGRWRRIRVAFLARFPICALCGAPSQVPDHWPITRRELVARGIANPDADEHLRPLCIPCHNSETAKATRAA